MTMSQTRGAIVMLPTRRAFVAAIALGPALLATPRLGRADAALETQQLVDQARMTVDAFQADAKMGAFRDRITKARAVLIAPQLLKAAFIVGAAGGSGVVVTRDQASGRWNGPAFYTLGGASFGLQIGAEASEAMVLAMTERGVNALLKTGVQLGAGANLAVGPIGGGAGVATQNLSADLISFSRSQGIYGGVSLEGAVLGVRAGWNEAFYGRALTPNDILVRGESSPKADALLGSVARVASLRKSGR
jgi:lipid-binding SYLF domain-containing protein